MKLNPLGLLVIALWLVGCGDKQDSPEVIDRLRGIGVAINPLVGQAGATVDLTLYAGVPLGETVSAQSFVDPKAPSYTVPVSVQLDQSSATYQDYPGFRLYQVKGHIPAPSAAIISKSIGRIARARYGIHLETSTQAEDVVGDALAVEAGAPEINWTGPQIALSTPRDGDIVSSGGTIALKATVTSTEPVTISWYVSAGTVAARRAASTKWTLPKTVGAYTVFATVRGSLSHGFTMTAPVHVTIQ